MVNMMSGLGTMRDKFSHTHYQNLGIDSVMTYEGSGLARKIVDGLGEDATREWRNWQGESVDIGALEATEARLGLIGKVEHAIHLSRLTGGSAILIGADTGRQDEPLDPARIGKDGLEYLTVLSRNELNAGQIDRDPASPYYGLPEYYTLSISSAVRIHPSRLAIFRGPRKGRRAGLPSDAWGQPVLETVYEQLTGCESSLRNTVSLLFDQTVDIFKIPGYAEGYEQLGEKYLDDVQSRIALAHGMKSVIRSLVMDQDEEYDRKGTSFNGISDIIDRAQQFLAGVSGYPVTWLFGRSPGGLNSTGESDVRMYYDRTRNFQRREVSTSLAILDECLIRSALGNRPDDVWYTWAPLWQMTATEKAELASKTATTLKTLADARIYSPEVLAKAGATALTESGALPGLESALQDVDLDEGDTGGDDDQTTQRPGTQIEDARVAPLYVSRKVENAEEILRWAADNGITPLQSAADLHVTLLYSRAPVDWLKAPPSWDSESFEVEPGGPRVLERFGPNKDTVVLSFRSYKLEWRHQELRKESGATHDWPEYQPHVTLALAVSPDLDIDSINPYSGKILLGPEIFELLEL